jgi:hypothetical protein
LSIHAKDLSRFFFNHNHHYYTIDRRRKKKKIERQPTFSISVLQKKRNKMCMYSNKPKAVSSIDAGDEVVM